MVFVGLFLVLFMSLSNVVAFYFQRSLVEVGKTLSFTKRKGSTWSNIVSSYFGCHGISLIFEGVTALNIYL